MTIKSRMELIVGLFIIIGLIILTSFVFLIRDFQIIKPGYRFNMVFGFANGLKVGAPVRLSGVDVGEIKSINIFYEPDSLKTKVRIHVWVKKDAQIPGDSQLLINTLGLLGEKYIEIMPGISYSSLVKENDTIPGQDPVAMETVTEDTRKLVLKIEEAVSGLNEVLKQVKTGEGTLGKFIYNDVVYKNLKEMTDDLKEMSDDLKRHPWKLFWKPKEPKEKKK